MDERRRTMLSKIVPGGIQFDCPMENYTTFRAGGKAEALCFVEDVSQLQELILCLRQERIPYLVIGNGSNLLVRDEGFEGVMIILRGKLASLEETVRDRSYLFAGGGVAIHHFLQTCQQKGLSGLEFLAGIPGTVGGAVAMNAGAWGRDMGSVVQEIEMLSWEGKIVHRERSELVFSYRRLNISPGDVIVKAGFQLNQETPETISSRTAGYLKQRKAKQPLEYPNAGSVFKNPPNDYAGRLIEMVGLKGEKVGGAMISEKHANFIVNKGGAKAADILALMDLARQKVMEKTGIELEPEIMVVGM